MFNILRFTGAAGTMLYNRCPPSYSCGAHGSFWTNATMPLDDGEVVTVPIYGSFRRDCSRLVCLCNMYSMTRFVPFVESINNYPQ